VRARCSVCTLAFYIIGVFLQILQIRQESLDAASTYNNVSVVTG